MVVINIRDVIMFHGINRQQAMSEMRTNACREAE